MRCAAVELGFTSGKSSYLEKLDSPVGREAVKAVQEWFRDLAVPFPVRAFYETKPTQYRVRAWRQNEQDIVSNQEQRFADG